MEHRPSARSGTSIFANPARLLLLLGLVTFPVAMIYSVKIINVQFLDELPRGYVLSGILALFFVGVLAYRPTRRPAHAAALH